MTKAQAGGKPGCSTVDHLIVLKQTIKEIRDKGMTAYIIFLDVQKAYDKAWLDAILHALNQNGIQGKNLRMMKKTQLQPHSQSPDQIWTNQEDKNKRQHQTRRGTIGNRICHLDRRNRQGAETENNRVWDTSKHNLRLAAMDGRCMPHTPWPKKTTRNTRCHKPRCQQIPHPIRSC